MSLSRGNHLALQRELEMWFSCTQTVQEETLPVKWTVEAYILNKLEIIVAYSTSSIQNSFNIKMSFFFFFKYHRWNGSVQFNSVTLSCPTLCDPMNHSTPGLPVHLQLPEFTQTHVHQVGDAIQPSHPPSSPSPPSPNPSQHQSLFQWVNSSHEVAKVLEFQLQHQSFPWLPHYNINNFL